MRSESSRRGLSILMVTNDAGNNLFDKPFSNSVPNKYYTPISHNIIFRDFCCTTNPRHAMYMIHYGDLIIPYHYFVHMFTLLKHYELYAPEYLTYHNSRLIIHCKNPISRCEFSHGPVTPRSKHIDYRPRRSLGRFDFAWLSQLYLQLIITWILLCGEGNKGFLYYICGCARYVNSLVELYVQSSRVMCSSVICFGVLPPSSVLRGRLISESNTTCLCVYNLIVLLLCPQTPSNRHHHLEELFSYLLCLFNYNWTIRVDPFFNWSIRVVPCLSDSWKSSLWWSIYYGLLFGGFYLLVVYLCVIYMSWWCLQFLRVFLSVIYNVYDLNVCAIYIYPISVHTSYVNSTTIYKIHHLFINYALPIYCACFALLLVRFGLLSMILALLNSCIIPSFLGNQLLYLTYTTKI
jgi:hypothetical protein